MTRTWVLALLIGVGVRSQGPVIARSCPFGAGQECYTLLIDGGFVKSGFSDDPEKCTVDGPYLKEWQHLVDPTEAPVKELTSPRGWKIVVTLGFAGRTAGPIFYLYFFDNHGERQLKASGDLFLEKSEIGVLFGTPDEFLVIDERGETGISHVTEAWLLPKQGRPERVLFTGGMLFTIKQGEGKKKPGLYINSYEATDSRKGVWRKSFFEWRADSKTFHELR